MKPENRQILDKIEILNGNGDVQEKANKSDLTSYLADYTYQFAGGTATTITLNINSSLINGYPVNFIASGNNSGSATTINNKPFYKPNTTTAPNLIAGRPYTAIYNSSGNCFFIKASAEGNTIPSHVLAGDIFSNDTDTGITGTMPNNGTLNYSPSGIAQIIPAGYTSGGTVAAVNPTAGTASWTIAGTYNWIVPAGVTRILVGLHGAGGGGGNNNLLNIHYGGAGGGGAYQCAFATVTPGSTIPIVVGAGGAGGYYYPNKDGGDGSDGGYSSFGSLVANGGKGGKGGTSTANGAGGLGGSASTSSPYILGFSGGIGTIGGGSLYGGGGAGAGGNGYNGFDNDNAGKGGSANGYSMIPGSAGGQAGSTSTSASAPGGGGGHGSDFHEHPGADGAVYIKW